MGFESELKGLVLPGIVVYESLQIFILNLRDHIFEQYFLSTFGFRQLLGIRTKTQVMNYDLQLLSVNGIKDILSPENSQN